ncbi:hypothetical protein [Pseudomonas phage vB_PaeM_RP7]|nr:MAG: hypothetical protein [Pseudomonas phage RP4]WAB56853.1 hypothetical protein [Pseudomonas phage vB_PaeM_RP15]WAB56968.1 hypothetical protein [Pseudomonas phage vB_PaeM_RP6]WAB57123.1 hypothetical protein [Pseudomonas phage vB_PaeM_RP7]WAB57260.1 hypothetical protein [Pseudomonas phage vB_PaeM_RP8]WAB57480.1 hypothetical protein [Pseudomonas phage vB_PaeM_RP9]WAB57595.1 hypothetical protein [Pseudomonas phage vB_PaeM_RP10]WAB57883.1 hypothetical protein [Pseudomonas phage vB_PaeM_RP11]
MLRVCYKCLHVGYPVRTLSRKTKVWYLGCPLCRSGVFFS